MRRIGKIGLVIVLVGLVGGLGSLMFISGDIYRKLSSLKSEHNDLVQDYNDLLDDYNDLLDNYSNLFSDYDALRTAFEEPLTSYVVPTISQVQNWLAGDDTDSFAYVNDTWMCGDFSAMLMTRAKTMNWRMRIALMFYSFNGESGWMSTDGYDQYGEHGHAFNLIWCQDGNDADSELDVLYIEPQTDGEWWFIDGSGNVDTFNLYALYTFLSGFDTIWDGQGTFWVNHYSYFG